MTAGETAHNGAIQAEPRGDGDMGGEQNTATDWYERRDELEPDQVFRTYDGSVVKLDRRVPGDGTKWYAADWSNGWAYYDSTIEPGDLTERLSDDYAGDR